MSLNKGKAKVKAKSKSIAKGAGKNKAAVMNTRSPKKPMAISGDTMSNYAMYKKGGKVTKIKKLAIGGPGDTIPSPSISPFEIKMMMKERNEAVREAISKAIKRNYEKSIPKQYPYPEATFPYPKKKGGSVKAKKFAALAPPYDKITAADRIAGAKKNARKK